MNVDLFVVLVVVLCVIIGIFIGIQLFKFYIRRMSKKLLDNAMKVLNGTMENKIKIDGQEYDATKFMVRDENDNEKLIDLKGGETIQNGRREEDSAGVEEIQKQEIEAPGEISSGIGKKKRFTRIRTRISRIRRRFG